MLTVRHADNLRDLLTDNFAKQFIGFDRFFNDMNSNINVNPNYPPYNHYRLTEKNEQEYEIIEVALAGFKQEEIQVGTSDHYLKISADKLTKEKIEYINNGIAQRSVRLSFKLYENLEVENVNYVDGILKIVLKYNKPEQLKPRQYQINKKV